MTLYAKRFSLFFTLTAISVFVIVVLIHCYVREFVVRNQLRAIKHLVDKSSQFVSVGFFQRTAMKEAVERNDKQFIDSQLQRITALDSFVYSIVLEDTPPTFEGPYIIESDGESLWTRFKIFTDSMEEHLENKTARVVWNLDAILKAVGGDFWFDKNGKPTHFGLRYKYSLQKAWLLKGTLGAFAILMLILIIHKFMVSNVLKFHWETDGFERLIRIIDSVDRYTAQHSKRVSRIAELIGKRMNLKTRELKILKVAGTLHDIGKIAIPPHVLNKPGKLDKEEYETVKRHPFVAAEILRNFPELSEVLPLVLYHHERQDGSGYPFGLRDSEIPLLARILAVADVFEALTSDRPYRRAMNVRDALDLMRKLPLDQGIVSILAENVEELEEIRGVLSESWST